MDFGTLLHTAQKNGQNSKKEVRYYSTKFEPPKKEQRNKTLSVNIKNFLAKKEAEEKLKANEAKKKREDLLALRSQDKKATRRVNVMLKRTKSANQSVIEDAVDNNNTAVTLAGPSQPDEDDYGYVSQEAAAFYNKMMEKYSKIPDEPKFNFDKKKKISTNLNSTKELVKAALEKEKEDAMMPHRRKRKRKDEDQNESFGSVSPQEEREEQTSKPKMRPAPPPMNFADLLKIAEKKQYEPIVIETKPKEEERPLTKKQKKELGKEKEWRERKETLQSSSNRPEQKAPGLNRIPKLDGHHVSSERVLKNNNSDANNRFEKLTGSKIDCTNGKNHSAISKTNDLHRAVPKISGSNSAVPKTSGLNSTGSKTSGLNSAASKTNGLNNAASKINGLNNAISDKHNRTPLMHKTVGSKRITSVEKPKLPPRPEQINKRPNSLTNKVPSASSQQGQQRLPVKNTLVNKSGVATKPASSATNKMHSTVSHKADMSNKLVSKYSPVSDAQPQSKLKQALQNEKAKKFPATDLRPKQFPPKDLAPKQFPPPDVRPKVFPPKDVRRKPPMGKKRRILDDDEEYDSEMDDFIDDGPEEGEDYSKYISEIFGYDKSKYRYVDDDVDNMESSFSQQMKEEFISTKIGIMEDLEDMKKEEQEKRKKALMKKGRL